MTAARSASAEGEFRALTRFWEAPPGTLEVPLRDDWNAPHLRSGERAVIDPNDREPQHGEFYLVQWSNGELSIKQALARLHYNDELGYFTGWWTADLVRPRSHEQLNRWANSGQPVRLMDGPRRVEAFSKALRGRVIGFIPRRVSP